MQVSMDQQLANQPYSFSALLGYARGHVGIWIEVDATELPGSTNQIKQSRLLQAARYRKFQCRTRTVKTEPDKMYFIFDGLIN